MIDQFINGIGSLGIAALVLQSFPDIEQAEMEFILERAAAGFSSTTSTTAPGSTSCTPTRPRPATR